LPPFVDLLEKKARQLTRRLATWAGWSRITKRLELENTARHETGQKKNLNRLRIFIAICIASSILVFFSQRIGYYFDYREKFELDPTVFDLTKSGVQWSIFYGKSKKCGDMDCLVTTKADELEYQKRGTLPSREFPLLNYNPGELIYLRTKFRVPEHLLKDNRPLVLQSNYIWAVEYSFYINDHLVSKGGEETLFITIPVEYIPKSGDVTFAFKIDPGKLPFQGLANRSQLLLGKKKTLLPLASVGLETSTTYYLWFLIPKLVILFVFAVLYIYIYRYPEMPLFLLFAFLSSCAVYFHTDYRPKFLDNYFDGRLFYIVVDIYAQIFFLKYVHEYFRRHSRIFNWLFWIGTVAITFFEVAFLLESDIRTQTLNNNLAYQLRDGLRLINMIYGFSISTITALYLAEKEKSRFRFITSTAMSVFFLVFLLLIGLDFMGFSPKNSYRIVEHIFDLLFFTLLSAIVAVEFGVAILDKNELKGVFLRFVDEIVINRILKSGKMLPAEKKNISVLVIDIRSFTKICQAYSPEEVCAMLGEFREQFVDRIKQYGGYVDKYIGDAIMAVFGAPTEMVNHSEAAIKAAIALRAALLEFNQNRRTQGLFEIAIGIGIATGDAVIGEVGAKTKSEYSVIGETVNNAFGLEELAPQNEVDIMINHSAFNASKAVAIVAPVTTTHERASREHPVYQLLGVLDESSKVITHDPRISEKIGSMKSGGTHASMIKNLKVPSYGKKAA
jgi:class 3 adenylate cyclase